MKNNILLPLIPIAFIIGSFLLFYHQLNGAGWFLFGAIFTGLAVANAMDNSCDCGDGKCSKDNAEKI